MTNEQTAALLDSLAENLEADRLLVESYLPQDEKEQRQKLFGAGTVWVSPTLEVLDDRIGKVRHLAKTMRAPRSGGS
jgi:hypothetical protein